jgi:hypothetical protein
MKKEFSPISWGEIPNSEKFVSDNISKIRKLHHNEFSTRKLKVNYINKTR